MRHVRVQREAAGAFHIANCAVALGEGRPLRVAAVALGARISRLDLNVLQQGEGARVQLDGLALIAGRQLADTHTLIDHAQPHGSCRQLHKCIVGGAAHAVFNGKIMVRPGAQLTDSSQPSRNLLLSRQGARRHQAAARDLRRRREVRARRDRRPARRRSSCST